MKAVIYNKYGGTDVLEIQDIPRPIPEDNEVLIKIFATTVTPVDAAFRSGNPKVARLFTGLFKPKKSILGTELSGVIEAVGANVGRFKSGDRVFAVAPDGFGAHAQYIAMAEDAAISIIPENLGHEDTAAICNGGLTALPFLRDNAKLKAGQKILIIGAAGSIGTVAVQLAASFGAEVTGVCSTANTEMVLALGAKHAIDYSVEDYRTSGKTYDVIFDTVGKSNFTDARGSLTPKGIYLTTVPDIGVLLSPMFAFLRGGKRAKMAATGLRKDADKIKDMDILKGMISAGELTTVIDRSYPLEQIATAHEYVEKGHKRGNLIITVDHPALHI
ncbi:MAG: NAD(P)-dependent alcohol dehydrogenase [Rhodobacteraceae bacterium]|nr:NAD(P)-dependent alcohol dehydrogenase [Paracoccaceae bacterium]